MSSMKRRRTLDKISEHNSSIKGNFYTPNPQLVTMFSKKNKPSSPKMEPEFTNKNLNKFKSLMINMTNFNSHSNKKKSPQLDKVAPPNSMYNKISQKLKKFSKS